LQRQVCDASLPLSKVVSHCRPWFGTTSTSSSSKEKKNAGNSNNDGWKILELNVQQTILDEHDDSMRKKNETDAKNDEDGNNHKQRQQQHTLVTEDGEILAYTIMRGTLQRILHDHLITEHYNNKKNKECITFGKRLSGISYLSSSSSSSIHENNGNEQGIICEFDDGTKAGPYDIVVGCDGIRSVVKQYINTGKIMATSSTLSSSYGDGLAIYSGLRITFAIQDDATATTSSSLTSTAQYNQYFGNGAYALTSMYGTGKGKPSSRGAFLVYSDEEYIGPFRKKLSSSTTTSTTKMDGMSKKSINVNQPDENSDWTTQDDQISSREHVMSVLQSSQVPGYDTISDIIRNSDRFFDLGIYLHNPFSWNGWVREVVQHKRTTTTAATVDDNVLSKNIKGLLREDSSNENTGRFVVTIGDASHAMPPFLGQGANQAIQDSYTLAAQIHEYNTQFEQLQYLSDDDSSSNTKQQQTDLKTLLKEYENKRWMPTTSITAKAAFLGYLEVGPGLLGNFRDAFFFVMGKIGVVKKVFLDAATPKM
jgi:2-polyprenyl-6-methoxyphenol hydroxylase-like FAD-dependent oxidoreductase